MDCAQTRRLLHGYLDQELDPANAIAVDEHLQSCAACKKIYDQYPALRAAVQQHASYYVAPAGLADRIRAKTGGPATRAPAKTVKPRWQWLQIGTAVAATAAVTWMAAIQLNGPSQDEALAEQVITSHARSMLTSHLADVATSDKHTVKPWLSSKLDFSPPVTDLTGSGFPLVGGRLDYLDNRPVAALVYRHRQHVIDLFIWPDAKLGKMSPMQTFSRRGYHLLHWTDAGMTYWAISDVDPVDLKAFAEAYASAK